MISGSENGQQSGTELVDQEEINKMKAEFVSKLEDIVGEEWVVTRREAMEDYMVDETAPVVRPKPAADVVLVKPSSSQEVSGILKLANVEKIPVFPRGGGTGLVGSAIPVENGIVLSLFIFSITKQV